MQETLTNLPAGSIGEYLYSNLGYMVAGVMAEQLTGKSWENLDGGTSVHAVGDV